MANCTRDSIPALAFDRKATASLTMATSSAAITEPSPTTKADRGEAAPPASSSR
jgi:hypothetical protein